jgi:hypothetical protein
MHATVFSTLPHLPSLLLREISHPIERVLRTLRGLRRGWAYKPTLDEVRRGRVFPASNRHDAPLALRLRVAVPVEVVDARKGPGYAVELGYTQCKMVVVVDEEVFLPVGVGGPRG